MDEHDYSDNFHCSCLDARKEVLEKQVAFRNERIRELGELVKELRQRAEKAEEAFCRAQKDAHELAIENGKLRETIDGERKVWAEDHAHLWDQGQALRHELRLANRALEQVEAVISYCGDAKLVAELRAAIADARPERLTWLRLVANSEEKDQGRDAMLEDNRRLFEENQELLRQLQTDEHEHARKNLELMALLEAAPRWVSVDERMPESGAESMLMCVTHGEEGTEFGFWTGERWLGTDGTVRGVRWWMSVEPLPSEWELRGKP